MPFSVRMTDGGRGMVYTGWEHLDGGDVLAVMADGLPDPEVVREVKYSVIDFTRVTGIDAPRELIQAISGAAAELAKAIPFQYVVFAAPDPLVIGLSRVYLSMIADFGWETEIYPTLAEAHG